MLEASRGRDQVADPRRLAVVVDDDLAALRSTLASLTPLTVFSAYSTFRAAAASLTPSTDNTGELTATLTFDQGGRLASASETANLKRDIRHIRQATRPLDADPIVRRMVEQDLLVMGKAAREYLDEQRATAGPDLRRAIDGVWQRILAEDR